jgi:PKD repeat protein
LQAPCNLTTSFTFVDNGNGNFDFTSSVNNSNGGESYSWSFGNGNSSSLSNPNHNYTVSGFYTVVLTVTDSNNCNVSFSDSINVVLGNSCNYTITAIDSNGTDAYFFTNARSSGSNFFWEFGDGNTSSNPGPIHTYSSPGVYNYCVTIDNCPSICDSIVIVGGNACNTVSDFSITNNGDGSYTFMNNSSGDINFTSWNFGDGSSSGEMSPTHTFLANGMYTIVLYSANVDNNTLNVCSDYSYITISVTEVANPVPCQAGVSIYTNPLNTNQFVITNSSIGDSLTYLWDFGDGNTSTLAYPTHFYSGNGPYNLCVTVDNGNGCSSSYCDTITSTGIIMKNGGFSIDTKAPPSVPTAISTIENEVSEFKVYPNPFKGKVNIEFHLNNSLYTEIFVTDLIGNNIAQINTKVLSSGNNRLVWDAEAFTNGVYLLNIKTENGLQVKKMILNR